MVISVSNFVNEEMKKDLDRLFDLREKALDICYKIPGYEALALEEKNNIYDSVVKEIAAL